MNKAVQKSRLHCMSASMVRLSELPAGRVKKPNFASILVVCVPLTIRRQQFPGLPVSVLAGGRLTAGA